MEEYAKQLENLKKLGGADGRMFEELNNQNIIKCNTCSKC